MKKYSFQSRFIDKFLKELNDNISLYFLFFNIYSQKKANQIINLKNSETLSVAFLLANAYSKHMKSCLSLILIMVFPSFLMAGPTNKNLQKLQQKHKIPAAKTVIIVNINTQKMTGFKNAQQLFSYPVSTASKGSGKKAGSYQTPLGLHKVQKKYGKGNPTGMIFKGRKATGEIFNANKHNIKEDWVTTRILHLKGLEKGLNAGPGIDSYRRLIYIHGTPFEDKIGIPSSKGCIRMKNADVMRLFKKVKEGDWVFIVES